MNRATELLNGRSHATGVYFYLDDEGRLSLAGHGGGDYDMMKMMVRREKWCSLDASLQK